MNKEIEVTEESLPQLQEALRAELKEEVLVQQVLDEVSGFLAFKDYPISEYSPIRFSEFPGNKVGIEVGGKTYLITKGSKPNVTTPKTEPKVEAKPKVEPPQQTVAQSSNITSFTTNNGQNIAFEGGMSKMFKITQVSSDEAIITLSEDIAMRKEALALVDGFNKSGLINFTVSPEPKSVQLIATKPGKLKLVNGQWKLTEPIQTTNASETPIANTSSSAKVETKVPKAEVGATTSALETAKAQHLQKIAQGNVVKPEGIEQLVRSLVPHNYANDNTIIRFSTRSSNSRYDYFDIIPKQSQRQLFNDRNYRKLLEKHYECNPLIFISRVTCICKSEKIGKRNRPDF